MKIWLVIINLVALVMTIVAVVFVIRGFVMLIRAKCRLCGKLLKDKSARVVGLVFIVAPVGGYALYAFLYESFRWGVYTRENSLLTPVIEAGILIVVVGGAYLWAFLKAKRESLIEAPVGPSD